MAGTFHYWLGWHYLGSFIVPMFAAVSHFLKDRSQTYWASDEVSREWTRTMNYHPARQRHICCRISSHCYWSEAAWFGSGTVFNSSRGWCRSVPWLLSHYLGFWKRTVMHLEQSKSWGSKNHHYGYVFHHPTPYVLGCIGHVSAYTDSSWILVGNAYFPHEYTALSVANSWRGKGFAQRLAKIQQILQRKTLPFAASNMVVKSFPINSHWQVQFQ